MCWTKDRPVDLVGIADCCGGGICGIGPSLSIGGSRCNVGFTMRRDLLASLVKVTGLAVDVSGSGLLWTIPPVSVYSYSSFRQ